LLTELVECLPKSVEARVLLANSYLRSLEVVPAMEHYRAALAVEPKNLPVLNQMGLCAVAMGDFEGALGLYRQAFAMSPEIHAGGMSALMLHRLGRLGEAVKVYGELLGKMKRDNPEAPHVYRGAAMLLRDAGAPLAADRYMHDLISLYRLNPIGVATTLIERDNSIDFYEWTRYAHKTDLARSLTRFDQQNPNAIRFPRTFILPEDRSALNRYAAQEPSALFIAKPHRGTGGQGIRVASHVRDMLDRDDVVVQRYIDRPYLADGRKGHIRLYGLVTSLSPFRGYLYGDGIVRFAPDAYDASEQGLSNIHAHVTNTALHRGHPKLEVSDDPAKENTGNVWSLRAFLKQMGKDGHDIDRVSTDLRALVKGFLNMVGTDGLFERQAKRAPRHAFAPKLFGLDVLIDVDGRPWLIEAQRKPAISGSALVERVNGRMFRTIFEMSNAYSFDDGMTADRIGTLAKDRRAIVEGEMEIEVARRKLFWPIG
jgi:tetratricopeptide (TPR) repeat protein